MTESQTTAQPRWQPLATVPRHGKIMVAYYAPTSWGYYVSTVNLQPDLPLRHRDNQLRYARAWMPILPEPEGSING